MSKRLCDIAEIGATGLEVRTGDGADIQYLMLFRRAQTVVGYHNVCPHQGYGLNLAPNRFFFTRDGWLMCAHHGACFDVDTGQCVDGPCRGAVLKPVNLLIRDESVWLDDSSD